eukprot:scaffold7206_cov143-Skeletonema_marinoi.AAC.7
MPPQSNGNVETMEQNLPTSFDVSTLITKLTQCESELTNVIQRVKIIELDPYKNDNKSPEEETRLFLAVAYGQQVVLAQLFALELRHVILDEDDEDSGDMVDDDDDNLEWVEVSNIRVLGSRSEQNSTDTAVIFPPSRADQLPLHLSLKDDNTTTSEECKWNGEITSCVIIPSPTITVMNSSDCDELPKQIIQRTVGIVIGTSQDQVYSIPIHVSGEITPNDNDEVKFFLEYDKCETVTNNLRDDVDCETQHPVVFQILPRKFNDSHDENNGNACDRDVNTHGASVFHGYVDGDMQVFHPSVCHESNDTEETNTCIGIKSLTFRHDGTTAKDKQHKQGVALNREVIWVTYENGTMIKLPSWKIFSSVLRADWNDISNAKSDKAPAAGAGATFTAIPLSGNIKSPLDTPPADQLNSLQSEADEPELSKESVHDYWSMLKYGIESTKLTQGDANQPMESALLLAGQSMPASTMPLQFNSSRIHAASPADNNTDGGAHNEDFQSPIQDNDQQEIDNNSTTSSSDETYGPATGAVLGGTTALMKGALGVAVDAMRWGLGKSAGNNDEVGDYEDDSNEEFMDVDESINEEEVPSTSQDTAKKSNRNARVPFMGETHVNDLFPHLLNGASLEFSDLPRRFESAKIDPSGTMAVTTDNLGRVILFDLETNQPIRMWKGMRNVSCYFTELWTDEESGSRKQIYLVIHFQRKGIVEIYRLRQGPRVSLVAVPEQNECVVMECYGPPSDGRIESFLLEVVTDAGEERQYIIDNLIIDDPDFTNKVPPRSLSVTQAALQNARTMQLNLFMQLLASDTNVPCSSATVLATFKRIKTLADLGEGLEALSKCNRLEDEMGVVGSSFHSQAVAFCKSRLDQVKKVESEEGSGMTRKAAISDLESKLSYHEKLINAFDTLNNFESKDNLKDIVMDEDSGDLRSISSWASEALSWLLVASGNDAASSRFAPAFPDKQKQNNKPLRFSHFARRCASKKNKNKLPSGDNDAVYFTPVKRDRAPIIARIFRPLLRDLFVFKVVNTILTHLGIDSDFDTLQLYFGEWLRSLPADAIKANMSGNWRPMVRWLHDMILNAYQRNRHNPEELDDASLEKVVKLESLLKFCNEIEDLPKAFFIAVICVDAVSTASLQIEEKTYGKITQMDSIRPWETLLRRLRVCLLVSLRLSGEVDSGGFNPMTVSSVSKPGTFSTYAWIAKDELTLSHENQVLMAMETAYMSSSEAFYPSTADGDATAHKKAMLQSCSNSQRGSLRSPSGLTSDSLSPPLLFYLKDHGRCTTRLAAHRALILVGLWGQTPGNMLLLRRCVESLQIAQENTNQFGLATLLEIWQSRIRPVFQSLMFGLGIADELSHEVFSSLIEDRVWLSEFTFHARTVLGMILECTSKNLTQDISDEDLVSDKSEMWPPLRECPILSALVSKLCPVKSSSVMLHHIVAFTFEMTHDIDSIASAVPSFTSLFSVGSLFSEMPPIPKESIEQRGLIDQAIVDRAQKSSSNPIIDNFDCIKDVELVGKAFGLDPRYTRTRYLIEIIRLGKDASINDLLGGSSAALMKPLFIEELVEILCVRLHDIISSLKRTKQYRGVVSRLDAEASTWVKEQAERITSQDDEYTPVSLIITHSLILRLRSMAENDALSEQINSLCLISETLLKAVREQEQQRVMDV